MNGKKESQTTGNTQEIIKREKLMKRLITIAVALLISLGLIACGTNETAPDDRVGEPHTPAPIGENTTPTATPETGKEGSDMILLIGDTPVQVNWEDNRTVEVLRAMVASAPLTVSMSMYGGFEQVGPIGQSLPKDDRRITTEAGDIVLYSGNKIVVFYGSNTWEYTKLGHISDKTAQELAELLGNGDVSITIRHE